MARAGPALFNWELKFCLFFGLIFFVVCGESSLENEEDVSVCDQQERGGQRGLSGVGPHPDATGPDQQHKRHPVVVRDAPNLKKTN